MSKNSFLYSLALTDEDQGVRMRIEESGMELHKIEKRERESMMGVSGNLGTSEEPHEDFPLKN